MLHLSRLILSQMVFPIWVRISLSSYVHHHVPPDSQDEVPLLESPLLDFLVEGSRNSSLIKLDLLLSLQVFII